MKKSHALQSLPIPVKTALKILGEDIKNARRRRRISTTLMAERANISRATLTRVEKGDPSVSIGIYASVLFVLDLTSQLSKLADPGIDELGRMLEEQHLPKKIKPSKL